MYNGGNLTLYVTAADALSFGGTFQLDYRLTTAVSPIRKIATGLARQYQFNGSTSATYKGFTKPEAGINASAGVRKAF